MNKEYVCRREEVRASRAAVAGRNHLHVRSVDIHRVNLIAFTAVARRLKDQFLAVGGKVSFGILSAKGQLFDIAEMLFLREGKIAV